MQFQPLIPELSVSDLPKSLSFYRMLGFAIEYERKDDKFAMISREGAQLMLEERNGVWETGELVYPFGRGVNFEIGVEDCAPLLQALEAAEYPLFRPCKDSWYQVGERMTGNREFLVMDPDGYLLRFAQTLTNDSPV